MIVFQRLITLLELLKYEQAVLCPGARNALLVKSILESNKFQIWTNPDERSASFFGLGLSKNQKACVVTTSGTAVSECLSAVIEAHYQRIPLMIISADRPKRYKDSGAPQAINQVRIFGYYAHYIEIDDSDLDFQYQTLFETLQFVQGPIHLNIFCEDPKDNLSKVDWVQFKKQLEVISSHDYPTQTANQKPREIKGLGELSQSALLKLTNPIVIIGPINSMKESLWVQNWVDGLDKKIAVINESPSNVISLQSVTLSERFIIECLQKYQIQSVIKIGGTPTTNVWRVLDDKLNQIPVYNFSSAPYPGLSRKMECSCSLLDLTYCQIQTTSDYPDILKHENNLVTMKERLFKSYPDSEISWFHYIRLKNHQSKVYLGNSLPIRYWDFVGGPSPNEVWANRGANGIDGQISSFLGWVLSSRSQIHSYIGVFGDLTAFYDIQSFWIYHQYKEKFKKLNIQIWIINNQGGQIFQKLLRDPVFLNQHSLRFNKISEMFDITYYRFESPAQCDDSVLKTPGLKIIEVLPNMEQQMHFDREWSQV